MQAPGENIAIPDLGNGGGILYAPSEETQQLLERISIDYNIDITFQDFIDEATIYVLKKVIYDGMNDHDKKQDIKIEQFNRYTGLPNGVKNPEKYKGFLVTGGNWCRIIYIGFHLYKHKLIECAYHVYEIDTIGDKYEYDEPLTGSEIKLIATKVDTRNKTRTTLSS